MTHQAPKLTTTSVYVQLLVEVHRGNQSWTLGCKLISPGLQQRHLQKNKYNVGFTSSNWGNCSSGHHQRSSLHSFTDVFPLFFYTTFLPSSWNRALPIGSLFLTLFIRIILATNLRIKIPPWALDTRSSLFFITVNWTEGHVTAARNFVQTQGLLVYVALL